MPGQLTATSEQYADLEATLLNTNGNVALAKRFRALFTLRNLKTRAAIDIIGKGFSDSSALLGHELAYVLGQINDVHALPYLEGVLRDQLQHPMVRHEAAEAMGAISSPASIPILEEYLNRAGEDVSVKETCEIALAKIHFDHQASSSSPSSSSQPAQQQRSPYDSIDPAPSIVSMHNTSSDKAMSVTALREQLLDANQSLFARYRAMFALRNMSTDESVLALADGFSDGSALFRHEIAYVFGQMSHPASVPSLVKVLENEAEDEMVRHEAAEALGSIATEDVLATLKEFSTKGPRVVRESCEVALDMYNYENSGELHYAETLKLSSDPSMPAVSVVA